MIARYSVRRPYTIIVAVLMVLILGYISFTGMSTDLLPSMDLPYMVVVTAAPGFNPEKVELSVTKPLETVLSTTNGINTISSVSRENMSMIIFEFSYGTNMDSAMIEMSNSIDLVRGEFEDTVGTPMLVKINPDLLPVMIASADMEGMDIYQTSDFVEHTVLPSLERVNGVASVDAMGLLVRQIRVTLNQDKIDGINDRILEEVDRELAEAERKLREGRTLLSKEKSKLQDKMMQSAELGMKAISYDDLKTQAMMAMGEVQMLLPVLEQLTQQKEAIDALISLLGTLGDPAQSASIQEMIRGLELQILTLQQGMEETEQGIQTAETALQTMTAMRTELQAMLATLPDTPEHVEDRADLQERMDVLDEEIATTTLYVDQLQTLMNQQEESLTSLLAQKSLLEEYQQQFGGVDLSQLTAIRDSLNQAILVAQQSMEQMPGQQAELMAQLQRLSEMQVTNMGQQMMLNAETMGSMVAIALMESELNEAARQLENGRQTAYETAGLKEMLTMETISQLLTAQNFAMPAGNLIEGIETYAVKVGEMFKDVDSLSALQLFQTTVDGVGTITLTDVADIEMTDNADSLYAKINGNNGILLTLQKQSNASTAEVSAFLRERFMQLEETHDGLRMTALNDQGIYIDIVIGTVLDNLLWGGLLAILVLFLFLKNLRPTIIVALSIPISLMLAMVFMYFTGVNLNIISLAGLALGVGMLVDNSIVVIENIYRLRSLGVPSARAAVQGAKQVAAAIASSTLTTVCVFLPIVFTEGISRELFTDMGLTIAYSLLASLIIALSLVPTLSSTLLRHQNPVRQRWFDALVLWYRQWLAWALRKKAVVFGLASLLLCLAAFGAFRMGTAFLPKTNSNEVSVSIDMPPDSTVQEARAMSDIVTERIRTIEGVEMVGAMQGGGMMALVGMGSGSGRSTGITMYVLLEKQRKNTSMEIERLILEKTADLNCEVSASGSTMDMAALSGSGIEVEISGEDLDTLAQISGEIADLLRSVSGTMEVSDGMDHANTETRITVDKEKAVAYGLTVAQVYQAVAVALRNEVIATTLSLSAGGYPVLVTKDTNAMLTQETLRDLILLGTKNMDEKVDVRLSDIASIEDVEGFRSIRHESLGRTLSATAAIAPGYNIGLVSREVAQKLADYTMPVGYAFRLTGENETINTTMRDLLLMILLAVVMIYFIMVAQFQSLLSPFIIMFTIPLAFTGGLLALWMFGFEISTISLLGFPVLAGVVVNNGIVFVDYVNQLRQENVSRYDALIWAGTDRLRPILMTALTTILGLGTLSFGIGTGADLLQPMAIVIVGGLLYATVLTLFVVPCLYDVFQKKPQHNIDADLDEEAPEETVGNWSG